LLLRHFTRHHAQLCNKSITNVAPKTVAALCRYSWPGNVRELENVVERSVILSQGSTLEVPLAELTSQASTAPLEARTPAAKNARERAARMHIEGAHDARWVIAGPGGAAATTRRKTNLAAIQDAQVGNPSSVLIPAGLSAALPTIGHLTVALTHRSTGGALTSDRMALLSPIAYTADAIPGSLAR